MNPTAAAATLLGHYAEWSRLTDAESSAIREGAWIEVDHQQSLKQALRQEIVRAMQEWHAHYASAETARDDFEREFRPVVSRLIQQEQRNQDLLQDQRRDLEDRLAAATHSASRLRSIQRSYGPPSGTRWQSYS